MGWCVVMFIFICMVWLTILTHRTNKHKYINGILLKRNAFLLTVIQKLKLTPNGNIKKDKTGESQKI